MDVEQLLVALPETASSREAQDGLRRALLDPTLPLVPAVASGDENRRETPWRAAGGGQLLVAPVTASIPCPE